MPRPGMHHFVDTFLLLPEGMKKLIIEKNEPNNL